LEPETHSKELYRNVVLKLYVVPCALRAVHIRCSKAAYTRRHTAITINRIAP
jgi:hypothetical protein